MTDTDEGDFRITKTDASETVRQVLFEGPSEQLDVSTDPRQQIIVPMSLATLREDDKLLIEYKTGTATTVDYGNSTVRIPIRRRNVRTGNVADSYLRHSNFASADVSVGANSWVKIGSYTVPAQEEIRIGQAIAENSRIYVNLVETA